MPYKTCPKCNKKSGVRSFFCECGHEFIYKDKDKENKAAKPKAIKNRVKKLVPIDWRQLKVGEKVKVIKGSGPYRFNNGGERTSFGHSGEYFIKEIREDGLLATQKGMTHFIYMGEDRTMDTGTILTAHKILARERDKNEFTGTL
jgi:hypothetical protein